jgi:diguanylate cyclase (GGDEF)-like protein/PAS domain S-box-containing protein
VIDNERGALLALLIACTCYEVNGYEGNGSWFDAMRTRFTDPKTLAQGGVVYDSQGIFVSTFWRRFLPAIIATTIVSLLFQFNICQHLENFFYQVVLWQTPIELVDGLGVTLLAVGLGLGGLLAQFQFKYQLWVWGFLCISWGFFSLSLAHLNYFTPIATLLVFFGLQAVAAAIAEVIRTYANLRRSEERYALAARGSNEGLWDWNLQTNCFYFSPRWQQMLGYEENELGESPDEWFERVHPLDRISLKTAIVKHLEGDTHHFEQEYRLRHKDGSYRWMLGRGVAVHNWENKPDRMVGSQTDITQRKRTEEELWRNAFFDRLTGLPNRAGFIHHLQPVLEFHREFAKPSFAVLWLDIDCFEVINNSFGDNTGDRLLIAVAHRLRSFLSPSNIVARMGGDEFAIALNQIREPKDATNMAEQIQQMLALPFTIGKREIFITVSIGIALNSIQYNQPEHMLRDADTAMHRAKTFGRSRYQVFDQTMRARMVVKLLLENDLRRAIASEASDRCEELQLLYQPIIHLETGWIVGFEALMRWQHPEQGVLSPRKFMAMAEETGLIVPMSWWALRSACCQMRKWQLAYPEQSALTVSVNLSSQQFSMPGLHDYIQQILYESSLDPRHLKLEVTESMLMDSTTSVVSVLRKLRALGVQLAIDDFGTGYSSLSYLARFPINTLKIDRSFVSNINSSSDSWEIVRTIHLLAHNLGMDVTAEGVETAAQVQQLLKMNCDRGQGFFFSPPLAAEAVGTLLKRQRLEQQHII